MREPKTICVQFSGPMILAMLADRKTQTRRLGTSPLRHLLPGDKIVVREHWKTTEVFDEVKPTLLPKHSILYLADGIADCVRANYKWGKHRQAMHMLAADSRMTLTVTDVRMQRLQDISRADAIAEGLVLASNVIEEFWRWPEPHHENLWLSPPAAYRHLWNAINGDGAWEKNPTVVAISFSVERISR